MAVDGPVARALQPECLQSLLIKAIESLFSFWFLSWQKLLIEEYEGMEHIAGCAYLSLCRMQTPLPGPLGGFLHLQG